MNTLSSIPEQRRTGVAGFYTLFLRTLSVFCLYAGVIYWAQLAGVLTEPVLRFDLLPTNARIVLASLAVIMPFAALGLWMMASWGVVVWLIVAGLEILMHTVWSDTYGENIVRVGFHAVSALTMMVCVGAILYERRRRRLIGY